jgi:hypothetical protein
MDELRKNNGNNMRLVTLFRGVMGRTRVLKLLKNSCLLV